MKRFRILFNIFVLSFILLFSGTYVSAKTISFAMASDIHYTLLKERENRDLSKSAKALKGFVDRVNENNYDFVVFLGDSIDKSNPESLKGFLNIVKDIKVPYYMVLGNHDVHKISGMTKEDYLKIVSENNKNQKKAKGSYYFNPSPDVVGIVLDSVSTGMPSTHGMFNEKTLKWLDEALTKNKNKKVVIFQHVPYVEPSESPSHEILNKTDYAAVIKRHDNIMAICSGHFHAEAVNLDDRGVYHYSSPALFSPPYNYREVTIQYDKLPLGKVKNFKLEERLKPAI